MRKLLLGALLPLIMLSSCSNNDELEPQQGEGTLVLKTRILTDGVQVIPTRAETSTLFVTIKNRTNNTFFVEKMRLPDNRVIGNIPVGNYDITLSSYPDGFIPAFGCPWYEGAKQNVQITANSNQNVSIDCIQKNAGVRFIYDSSLQAAGLEKMYPVVSQNGYNIKYYKNQKEQTAYFNAAEVVITLTDEDGAHYTINGGKEKRLILGSEQLWEVTLKAGKTTTVDDKGSITIGINIVSVNEPTNREQYVVDGSINLFTCTFVDTPDKQRFINIETPSLMSEMAFYHMEKSLWDNSEMTKDKIMTLGRKLSSSELAEVNAPNGKGFELTNMKERVAYCIWVYASGDGEEQIKKFEILNSF